MDTVINTLLKAWRRLSTQSLPITTTIIKKIFRILRYVITRPRLVEQLAAIFGSALLIPVGIRIIYRLVTKYPGDWRGWVLRSDSELEQVEEENVGDHNQTLDNVSDIVKDSEEKPTDYDSIQTVQYGWSTVAEDGERVDYHEKMVLMPRWRVHCYKLNRCEYSKYSNSIENTINAEQHYDSILAYMHTLATAKYPFVPTPRGEGRRTIMFKTWVTRLLGMMDEISTTVSIQDDVKSDEFNVPIRYRRKIAETLAAILLVPSRQYQASIAGLTKSHVETLIDLYSTDHTNTSNAPLLVLWDRLLNRLSLGYSKYPRHVLGG